MEYAYDANGNMVKDLDRSIVAIRYNLLNLPDTVQFANGNQIVNRYDASGRKLGSRSMTLVTPLMAPVSEGTILGGVDVNAEDDVTASGTDYVGNVEYTVTRIYDFDVRERPVEYYYFSRLHNPEGYVTSSTSGSSPLAPVYSYYSRDHLGNNREVWRAAYYRGTKYNAAAVTQRTQYYPSGLPWSESLNPDIQKRKYNGKEFVETNGYDMYDYEARGMYPAIMRFTTVDPLAEKYYSISPYAYCGNNPLRFVDPTEMEFVLRDDQIEGLEKLHEILDSSKPFKNDRFVISKDEKNKPKKETETTSLPLVLATTGEIIGALATAVVSTALLVLTFSGDTPLYKQADNYIPPPNSLDGFPDATKVKPKAKRARWHLPNGDIAEWDSQHGELEVYDKTGKNHRGAYDPKTGKKKKDGDPKRKTEPK